MTTATKNEESVKAGVPPVYQLLITLTLFVSYMMFAIGWQAGDRFIETLGFSASRTALHTNAITLAQVVGSLIAANVMLKLGPRKGFALAGALIVFGGLLSFTQDLGIQPQLVFFIRFVLGLGGAFMVVLLSAIVARVLTGRPLQVANGVNSVAFNTGMAVAITLRPQMSGDNAATAVLVVAGISLVLVLVWLVASRALPKQNAQVAAGEESYTMRDGFREWFNWVFALAYAGLLSYYIVAFTFMDGSTIRWVIYAGVIGALAGTVAASQVPDRLKPRIVVVAAALQLVCAAAVLARPDATLIGVLLGLVIFFPMPFFVQLAFIRPGATPRRIAVTFSIFWAVAYAGSVIIIQIFAWIADATGGTQPGSNVPVSLTPMIFIVIAEATFLIGALLLSRFFARHGFGGAAVVDEADNPAIAIEERR